MGTLRQAGPLSPWEQRAITRLLNLGQAARGQDGLTVYLGGIAVGLALQVADPLATRRLRLAFNRWIALRRGATLEQVEYEDVLIIAQVLGHLGAYDGDDSALGPLAYTSPQE
jgi:hypothetical protein